jgi:glycerophosphoryl diester phosphodiesterase
MLQNADASEPSHKPSARQLVESRGVLIIAHRGNSAHAPENTLPAFRSALQSGANLVELDYYHSVDGVPVVFHDETLERTTNAKSVLGRSDLPIDKTSLSDLRRLDAGSWFADRFRGTRIPTLREALDVIQQRSCTLIERKGGDAGTCVRLLTEKQLLDQVVVQSFDWDFVRSCRRLAPRLALAALGSKQCTLSKLEKAQQTGCQVIAWNHNEMGPEQIEEIHRRGLKAWVYTVNDPARAKDLIRAGIDGIITDDPARLLPLAAASR